MTPQPIDCERLFDRWQNTRRVWHDHLYSDCRRCKRMCQGGNIRCSESDDLVEACDRAYFAYGVACRAAGVKARMVCGVSGKIIE